MADERIEMIRRPLVHVLEHIHPSALERLAQEADIITAKAPFPSGCDAVIVRARKITADAIAACPNLKVIGKHGAGLDAIDLVAADDKGVAVLSTPGVNAQSVADLAVGFALALLRNIHTATLAMKANRPLSTDQKRGYEISELKIGILGIGATGRATARRLVGGFGARVQAFDPGIPEEAWPKDIARTAALADLLKTSQLLFLHAPLLPSTRRCIDAAALNAMPKGAYIVNCARGEIVDEAALAAALASGHIAGAASDVFEREPPASDNPLLACASFLATPHIGATTSGALRRMGLSIVEQVLDHLRAGREPAAHIPVNAVEEK